MGTVSVLLGTLLFMGGASRVSATSMTGSQIESMCAPKGTSIPETFLLSEVVKEVKTPHIQNNSPNIEEIETVSLASASAVETIKSVEYLTAEADFQAVNKKEEIPQNSDSNKIITVPQV